MFFSDLGFAAALTSCTSEIKVKTGKLNTSSVISRLAEWEMNNHNDAKTMAAKQQLATAVCRHSVEVIGFNPISVGFSFLLLIHSFARLLSLSLSLPPASGTFILYTSFIVICNANWWRRQPKIARPKTELALKIRKYKIVINCAIDTRSHMATSIKWYERRKNKHPKKFDIEIWVKQTCDPKMHMIKCEEEELEEATSNTVCF